MTSGVEFAVGADALFSKKKPQNPTFKKPCFYTSVSINKIQKKKMSLTARTVAKYKNSF